MMEFATWNEGSTPEGVELPKGVRVRWVYDEDYQTPGSYCYDTPEENSAAEEWELERLTDGRLVALGCIVEDVTGEHLDSLWGIVIEPNEEIMAEFFEQSMSVPSQLEVAQARFDRASAALKAAHKLLTEALVIDAQRSN
jgi:hypothetical protein